MRNRVAIGVVFAWALVACAKASPEHTYLQAQDLQSMTPGFDPNEIVDSQSFVDFTALDSTATQLFLAKNPYNRESFLSTYQSNGVPATDAIVRSASTYHLNPLVFLVRAETAQGLIGEQFYPFPPSRVEYAFGCGCASPTSCDPMLAGFDRQVDCLARALRTSLDEIAKNGATAGGWAPGQGQKTLDGKTVTPADDSTAALYQYLPQVGTGSTGNWLVWNVWQEYINFIGYSGPAGPTGTAQIGDPCMSPTDCAVGNAVCAQGANYPDGLCTSQCSGSCPMPNTFCADFTQSGYCLAQCDPTDPTACRTGYACLSVHRYGSMNPADAQNVCSPKG